MAALTVTVPTTTGAICTTASASASDTLTQAQLLPSGVNLRISTAGTTSNVSISDGGTTPSNNPGTVTAIAMAATEVRYAYISPTQVNLGTGLVTITSSSQTNLKYEVTPA
jgi:hypothetical protein